MSEPRCFICVTCGSQFALSSEPPETCPICEDQRQYIPPEGQKWTTLAKLRAEHRSEIRELEPGLLGIGMEPGFAIGQRALLVQTPEGNTLWDCISLIDDAAVEAVRAAGGLQAIAISHPHYYGCMVEWSRAFDAPIYLHEAESRWVMRPDPAIRFWNGETMPLPGGLTLVRCGGHFEGGQVLHWPAGAGGRGALLTGDIISVVPDAGWVSFMYSYPNLIPLPAASVQRIVASVTPFSYDRVYGAWWPRVIPENAQAALSRSAERYLNALRGEMPEGATRVKQLG